MKIKINKATPFTCELVVCTPRYNGVDNQCVELDLIIPEQQEMCSVLSVEETDTLIVALTVLRNAKKYGVGADSLQISENGYIYQVKGRVAVCLYDSDKLQEGMECKLQYLVSLKPWVPAAATDPRSKGGLAVDTPEPEEEDA